MKYDILFAGPGCLDDNVDYTGETVHSAGGAVWFSSFAARAAGASVYAAVVMNPADRMVSDAFKDIPKKIIDGGETTHMRNVYHDATREKRDASVVSQSRGICTEDLPDEEFGLCHLGGLLYGDFPEQFLTEAHEKFSLSADMQGFLRHNENGSLKYHDWKKKLEYLKYFKYLKVDANEAEIMTGFTDRKKAAWQLKDWGAGEVLLSYNEEMLVCDGKEFYTCPVKSRNLSGRTGRGDTVFGSYLARREHGHAAKDALLYATALVSLKMETPGPFMGTDHDVNEYIKAFY